MLDPDLIEPLRSGDPDRFLATMAAPRVARPVLAALYAFNLEVARAPWVTGEPMIAEMRLQWWRDALEEIGAGGPVRAHPVVTALASILAPEDTPRLDALVAARRFDIYSDPPEDAEAFDAYIEATAGHLHWTAARLLGSTRPEDVRRVARASGLANLFLAIPDLEARGKRPLVDGRPAAISALAESALVGLGRARPDAPGRIALLSTWRARGILKAAARDPGRVAAGTLEGSEFARRGGLLLKALRG